MYTSGQFPFGGKQNMIKWLILMHLKQLKIVKTGYIFIAVFPIKNHLTKFTSMYIIIDG